MPVKLTVGKRIFLPTTLLLLASVCFVGLLALWRAERAAQERISADFGREIATAGRELHHWIDERRGDVESWREMTFIRSALEDSKARAGASADLARLAESSEDCQSVNLLDTVGITVASSDPRRLGKDFSDRGYFKEAIQGRTAFSPVLVSKIDGSKFFTIASPVKVDDRILGVLYAPINTSHLKQSLLDPMRLDSGSFAFLVSLDSGKILAHADTALVLKKTVADLPFGAALDQPGKVASLEIDGRRKLVTSFDVEQTGWRLWVVRDVEAERERVASLRLLIVLSALAAAALASAFGWLALRPVVAALREATAFARTVGEGDASGRLAVSNLEELAQLADGLNAMAARLAERAEIAQRIASQDLTARVEASSPRDVLGQALRAMVETLRTVIGAARDEAGRVASSSTHLEELSRDLAASAEETSSEAKGVARSSETIQASVQAVAAGSEQMGASIHQIAQESSEAAQVARQAVERTRSTQAVIARLGEASSGIGRIVDVIRGISDQTKLLALNATIEAARAGEAGRGFAIVAGEVKTLSTQTAQAIEEIRSTVEAMQRGATEAVDSVDAVVSVIERISEIASSIATAVEEQSSVSQDIARRTADAAYGVREIGISLAAVSSAAAIGTQSASETRLAAQDLRASATGLAAMVDRFRLP